MFLVAEEQNKQKMFFSCELEDWIPVPWGVWVGDGGGGWGGEELVRVRVNVMRSGAVSVSMSA